MQAEEAYLLSAIPSCMRSLPGNHFPSPVLSLPRQVQNTAMPKDRASSASWAGHSCIHRWLPQPHGFQQCQAPGCPPQPHGHNCMREPSRAGVPCKHVMEKKPDTPLGQAPPPWIGPLRNSTSSRDVWMLSYLCPPPAHVHMYPNQGAQVTNPAGFTSAPKPGLQGLLLYPTARGCSHQSPQHIQPQHGLTLHNYCAHSPKNTPLSLHSGGRYFLHISHNSADGQSLHRLFLPSGQKSHVTSALQKSNPSQRGEYLSKMGTWGLVFQLNHFPGEMGGWSEKPSLFSSDLQAMSTTRAAPAPLSSSPPTHSTHFNCGNRCGNKQVR